MRELNIDTVRPDAQYSTVQYDMNRENAGCKPRNFIYDPPDFLLHPEVFHNTIHDSYCISSGCNRIVLKILTSQTDHAPNRTRYDLILTYMDLAARMK
jgi:hypothetical protein